MQKIQPFIMMFVSLVCTAIFLTVGAFAAISHTVAVNISVNYTPPVKAMIKMSTNTTSYNYGVNGEGLETLYYKKADNSGFLKYDYGTGSLTGGGSLNGQTEVAPQATEQCCYMVMDNVTTQGIANIDNSNKIEVSPLTTAEQFQNEYNDLGVLVIFLEVINYTVAYNISCQVTAVQPTGTGNFTPKIYFDGEVAANNTKTLNKGASEYGVPGGKTLVTIELRTAANTVITPDISVTLTQI